jgi:DNA repair exonuclease SbcCD ATPase subunit
MKLNRVRLKNIARFRDFELDFHGRPLFAILAANGTGKSHLLCAITLALWNSMPSRRGTRSLYQVVSRGHSDKTRVGVIEIEFEYAGQTWRVNTEAKLTAKTSSRKATLERLDDGQWTPLAGPSAKDFDSVIPEYFGDYESFLACALSAQRGVGDLTAVEPKERYLVFAEMIGARQLIEVGKRANDAKKAVMLELQAAQKQIEPLANAEWSLAAAREALASREADIERLTGQLEGVTCELEANTKELQELNLSEAAKTDLQERLEKSKQDLNWIETNSRLARERLSALEFKARGTASARKEVKELEDAERALSELNFDINVYNTAATDISRRKSELQGLDFRISETNQRLAQYEAELPKKQAWLDEQQPRLEIDQRYVELWPKLNDHYTQQRAYQQGLEEQVRTLECQISSVKAQQGLASQAPDPEGTCSNCSLVAHALSAVQTLPDLERGLYDILLQLQQLVVPDPPAPPVSQSSLDFLRQSIAREAKAIADLKNSKQENEAALASLSADAEAYRTTLSVQESEFQNMKVKFDTHCRLTAVVLNLSGVRTVLAEAEAAEAQLEAARKAVEDAEARRENMDAVIKVLTQKLEDLTTNQKRLDMLERQKANLTSQDQRIRKDLESLRVSQGMFQQQILTEEKNLELWKTAAETVSSLEAKVKRLARLAEIFGVRGVLPLLIDQSSPEIEQIANELLSSSWPGLGRLNIMTQNDSGKEVIEITVQTADSPNPVDIDDFSGGEYQVLRTALRLAIGRWRSQRTGRPYQMLAFDETFDALDPENIQRVSRLLKTMSNYVDQVMVIAHTDEAIAEFDSRLTLATSGGNVVAEWSS